jgi:hypothetical protein
LRYNFCSRFAVRSVPPMGRRLHGKPLLGDKTCEVTFAALPFEIVTLRLRR